MGFVGWVSFREFELFTSFNFALPLVPLYRPLTEVALLDVRAVKYAQLGHKGHSAPPRQIVLEAITTGSNCSDEDEVEEKVDVWL